MAFILSLTLVPFAAHAYLLPLIGVGGVIMTMLVGLFSAVCAALFLVFYNMRRMLRRVFRRTSAPEEGLDNDAPPSSDH